MAAQRHRRRDLPIESARLPLVLRRFFETEAAGGMLLLAAALVALVWVNSTLGDSYETLWHTPLSIAVGSFGITEDLRHWVNDALMAIFFFVVGLEIKRELVAGQLQNWRNASLPAIAALGGMVVPAAFFLLINAGGDGSRGWGIPMATDIAFALGVLALLGPRVPTDLKLFLLTLAIVDDIGAIVVIALVYSTSVSVVPFAAAAGLLGLMGLLHWRKVTWLPAYVVLGAGVWLAVFESGVHATIAGVILGLLAPARPLAPAEVVREWAEELAEEPTPAQTVAMTKLANATVSVAERLEHALHPLSSFVIVPIFALANAGVVFSSDAFRGDGPRRVAAGVVVGLVGGKIVGILAGSVLAVKLRIGTLPLSLDWRQITGAAGLAGIGFTVSLFVTDLAFADAHLQAASKVGILLASVIASAIGATILLLGGSARRSGG